MDEKKIRGLIDEVKSGRMSRRGFVRRMMAVGITAPFANVMLDWNGVAQAQSTFEYKPTKRGGGGALKLLWWQGPTLLNPHFAVGTKDQDAARLFYEPLAAWRADGQLVPILAAEIPSRQNGGLSADGKTVTWKLKPGVKWHDGKPLTADDLLFNWEYAADPATAAVTTGSYKDVKVERVDDLTVRVIYEKATPFWADPFVGTRGMIIPKHLYADFKGAKSRDAPTNLKPVGTGPFKFVEFKPGDIVRGEINKDYHQPNKPFFDSVEMKGGGDAVSAARAVIQTGEYDYAWNLQVEDEILKRLEQGGKGKVEILETGNVEHIQINFTDPWTEVDGERAHIKTTHPTLSDPVVRKALAMLLDRKSVQEHIYGRTGNATANYLNNPPAYVSKNLTYEFAIEKAAKLLDDAGWKVGSDGIRAKDGKKLKYVYQTSINAPRQKTQQIFKQACQKAGIDLELKSITASVFFSSDLGNPDTYTKFYCDLQMYTTTMTQPDPELFMNQFISSEIATKDNKWQGRNIPRWRSAEYDKLYNEASGELDPVKRAAHFIRMNDIVVGDNAVIPVVARPQVGASGLKLRAHLSGWDNTTSFVAEWFKEA
jgi:peptide/nickel transport system substrate-binding protein